jgi:hypothetical protein
MRPILIIPIPKIRAEDLAEARRLNQLDAQRGAVELDDKGAVVDDLECRRSVAAVVWSVEGRLHAKRRPVWSRRAEDGGARDSRHL